MDIRELRNDDLDGLLTLYSQLHPSDPSLDFDAAHAVWKEILDGPGIHCYGAFLDEVLVSSCTLIIVPNLTRGARAYGLIENVVTHEHYRNQGIGTEIVSHALSVAWSFRCYKVMLMTGRKEEAVTRFYEGVGFDKYEKNAFVARPSQ